MTERKGTWLVAWLAEYQVSTGSSTDREMTADARMVHFISPLLAKVDHLKNRLEIKWAYDGSGNRVPFPECMEDCDGIDCRDETIGGLEERIAALQSRAFEDGAESFSRRVHAVLEAGNTEVEASAIVKMSEQMVRHYSRDVNERRLAVNGVKKLEEAWEETRANLFGAGSSPVH